MPDLEVYNSLLASIWESGWLTNKGKLHQQLQEDLKVFLNMDHVILTCNGTLPLQASLKSLSGKGEIITTPFSYVATSAAIVWEGFTPIFVDIDPVHLTIDEEKIESSITSNTLAILAAHVFGNPCNIEKIHKIADEYNLTVIYDAAHCFGVNYNGKSIFNYGDISTCSFHATKLFHTGEGGAFFCYNKAIRLKLEYSCNFGHNGLHDYHGLGINGKMSELHAAMGLSVLPSIPEIIKERKKIIDRYLFNLPLSKLQVQKIRTGTEWNYSYFPIIFPSEKTLLLCLEELKELSIFPRRYFYPSLNHIDYLKGQSMPISESIAERILCLPLYFGLENETIDKICQIISSLTFTKLDTDKKYHNEIL